MGRKRKRGQTKQSWGTANSRKQKKRRKIRGNGFNRGAKLGKDVIDSQVKLSNMILSSATSTSLASDRNKELPFPCVSQKVRFCGIRTVFSRLANFARLFQRSALNRFKSIRSVFLLLDWLKQILGCGLQAFGKFLLGKDDLTLTDTGNNFEEITRRMKSLEEEVKLLKCELAKKTSCPCGDHSTAHASATCRQGYVVPSLPIAPAPPPPPPPPVLPPPPPPLEFLKNKQNGSKGVVSKETKNKPPRTLVTLEDLKKVKLRKVSQPVEKCDDKENVHPDSGFEETGFKMRVPKKAPLKVLSQRKDLPQCVISLREIKKVALKRTKKETEAEKTKLWTPEEMVMMRRNLRKVNITRSPGGTPLVSDRNCENGTGLTPMMTKALRRKFQQAHPYSSPESPTGRRKRQSLSPKVDFSPNTPSPLLINKF